MIRVCNSEDFEQIWTTINDGASVYKGTIPEDRWSDPYMSREKLQEEIADGITFFAYDLDGTLPGVMGLQQVQDVTLIRHAYVRRDHQNLGIGGKLLTHLRANTSKAILIGAWADAVWAIRFYERNGFEVVSREDKERLLRTYWNVPERQIATSVVLREQSFRTA